ncbi:MAG: hypothetical protein GQ545_08525 [Candidatus Aminicenantes bacterium]|jgi:hypothetical protein|nr:hypothetical protein [Candidatus Aminicenantes bacterium]
MKKVSINSFELIKASVELASGKIWSLGTDMGDIPQHDADTTGLNNLYVEIPGREEGTFLSKDVPLTILR